MKCVFCGQVYYSRNSCPVCGVCNPSVLPRGNDIPKTLDELKAVCETNHLPLSRMRFFLDNNYTAPRAFGIYRQDGVFTVYKNKDDGTRAIRYEGCDEEIAVREIYLKMLEEIDRRTPYRGGGDEKTLSSTSYRKSSKSPNPMAWIFIILFFIVALCQSCNKSNNHGNSRRSPYYDSSSSIDRDSSDSSSWDSSDSGGWDSSDSDWDSDW